MNDEMIERYQQLPISYLFHRQEDQLYEAQQMSKWMDRAENPTGGNSQYACGGGQRILAAPAGRSVQLSFNLLIEMMIGYRNRPPRA